MAPEVMKEVEAEAERMETGTLGLTDLLSYWIQSLRTHAAARGSQMKSIRSCSRCQR